MRWLAVTILLLGVSAALVTGIYLRDRDTAWRLPQRTAADVDARMVMTYVAGPTCGNRCSYKVLANPRVNHWLARIIDRSRAQCVDIDVMKFAASDAHGISGVTSIGCDSIPAAAGGPHQ